MDNKYIDNKYIFKYGINEIPKNMTILCNVKSNKLTELIKSIEQKNKNKSIEIAIELHLSGYIDNLLNKLVTFYFNNINIAELSIINNLNTFFEFYYNKYQYDVKKNNPLLLINDIRIRNFILYLVMVCLLCNNRNLPKIIKLKHTEFDLKDKQLYSKNLKLISKYITDVGNKAIKNLLIPMSEIVNIIHNKKNIPESAQKVLYWISWLYEYEKNYIHNNYIDIPSNHKLDIDTKYKNDFIWIIWRMFIDYSNKNNKLLILKLFRLFKYKYTKGTKRSKSNMLITALYILIDPIPQIKYPILMNNDIYIQSIQESLKSNINYFRIYSLYLSSK